MSEQIIAILGIDLGKNSVSLAGLDAAGAVIVRKRTTRDGAIKFTAKMPSCVVAMEACCGAHFMAKIMGGLHSNPPGAVGGDRLLHRRSADAARAGDLLRAVFHPS